MPIRLLIIAIFSLLAASCAPVDLLNTLVSQDGFSVKKDINYGINPRQNLDVYLPKNVDRDKPVIMFNYGGSWQYGNKNDYLFVAQSFTSYGYVVVIPNYRIYPDAVFPDFLDDTASAVAWVHQNIHSYGAGNKNIILIGHSAGAYNSVMVALNKHYMKKAGGSTKWISAVIGIAGPYDFLPIKGKVLNKIFSPTEDQESMEVMSHVRGNAPRMLLLTGLDDRLVLPENSLRLYNGLKEKGNDVTLRTYDGVGHYGIAVGLATAIMWNGHVREDIHRFIEKITLAP